MEFLVFKEFHVQIVSINWRKYEMWRRELVSILIEIPEPELQGNHWWTSLGFFFLFWPRIGTYWSFWFDNDTSRQSKDQPMINLITKQGSSMRGLDGESSYQAGLSCYPLILRSSHDLLSHFLTVLPQKWKKYIVTENSRQILLRNLYTSFDR